MRKHKQQQQQRTPWRRLKWCVGLIGCVVISLAMIQWYRDILHAQELQHSTIANPTTKSVPHFVETDTNTTRIYNFPGLSNPTKTNPILIYITTHWNDYHANFMIHCWPEAVRHSRLLQHADVAIFATPNHKLRAKYLRKQLPTLASIFESTNLTIYDYKGAAATGMGYDRKHTGAILALSEAETHGYFAPYEWVIRLNPDVLIQDDEWFLDIMLDKKNQDLTKPSLLYVACHFNRTFNDDIHTDFFALRPSALPPGALTNIHVSDTRKVAAEPALTNAVRHLLASNRTSLAVPGATHQYPGGCRVVGTTVHHFHNDMGKDLVCPAKFRHTRRDVV